MAKKGITEGMVRELVEIKNLSYLVAAVSAFPAPPPDFSFQFVRSLTNMVRKLGNVTWCSLKSPGDCHCPLASKCTNSSIFKK